MEGRHIVDTQVPEDCRRDQCSGGETSDVIGNLAPGVRWKDQCGEGETADDVDTQVPRGGM